MSVVLIGAGLHARAIVAAVTAAGTVVEAYVDPKPSAWLNAPRLNDDDPLPEHAQIVIGIGGQTPEALASRLALLDDYLGQGRQAPVVTHPTAMVDESAVLEPGVIVLAGAIVQPAVTVGRGSIVNTGAIVEHDSTVGAGVHVAPGAVVLGSCKIGDAAMIGAGAVVLPGTEVPPSTKVNVATRYPK